MPVLFEGSRKLKEIVEKQGWTVYDTSAIRDAVSPWKHLNEMSPADYFEIGRHYLFIPNPPARKTRQQAYEDLHGLGPSLKIPITSGLKGLRSRGGIYVNDFNLYLFSRLFFEPSCLTATSPDGLYLPKAPIISLPYRQVERAFSQHFTIATREELQTILSELQPKVLN